MEPQARGLAVAALALAGIAMDWGLRRVARRLPLALARWQGVAPTAPRLPGRRTILLGTLCARAALWIAVLFELAEWFPFLQWERDMVIWLVITSLTAPLVSFGAHAYSALDLLLLCAALAGGWLAVGVATRLVRSRVLDAAGVAAPAQESIGIVVRSLLGLLVALITLQAWGIDVSSLTMVVSVLGLGLGFGLQHIVNNFVSGLLVSFERPVRPGDFIEVGGIRGTVVRVGSRSTVVRTADHVSVLIPNSRLLEQEVVNWSYDDPTSRLHVPVGVAYEASIPRVRAALLDVARAHPEVLDDPRPTVELRGFGDNAVAMELLVWIADPRRQARIQSDLNFRIAAAFRREGIAIPFPQRDVRLRAPALEGLARAWLRDDAHPGDDGVAELSEVPDETVDDFVPEEGPEAWSAERITGVLERLAGPDGVRVADRRHLLARYRACFVGREAVDWLVEREALTRAEAVRVGEVLVERGHVRHVLDEHGFLDGHFFYRFTVDRLLGARSTASASTR